MSNNIPLFALLGVDVRLFVCLGPLVAISVEHGVHDHRHRHVGKVLAENTVQRARLLGQRLHVRTDVGRLCRVPIDLPHRVDVHRRPRAHDVYQLLVDPGLVFLAQPLDFVEFTQQGSGRRLSADEFPDVRYQGDDEAEGLGG